MGHGGVGTFSRASLEFMVVFVGIWAALLADSWWEGRETRTREESYLVSLLEDFSASRRDVLRAIEVGDSVQAAAVVLMTLEGAEDGRRLGTDSLTALLGRLIPLPTFEPVTRTYDNILGAGDLLTIQSAQVRSSLAEFQSRLLLMNVVQETQERQLVGLFQPYAIEHLDYVAVLRARRGTGVLPSSSDMESVYDVLGSREFRNWIAIRWEWARDLAQQHRAMLGRVEQVLAALSDPLNSAPDG